MVATEGIRDHIANAAQMVKGLIPEPVAGQPYDADEVFVTVSVLEAVALRLTAALALIDEEKAK